jgi:Tim44-like domain
VLNTLAYRASRAIIGTPVGLSVGLLLAIGPAPSCAATLGNVATSVGVFSALATLLVIQGWPAQMPGFALSGAAAGLVLAVGAAWLWRVRAPRRLLGWAGVPLALRGGAASVAPVRTLRPAPAALPPGLDVASLLVELRAQFVRLQAAWDAGETDTLRALTTPQMLDELCFEWPGAAPVHAANRTDVVTLEAELLGFEELAGADLVSVEFSGLIREAPGQAAVPFRELWMLARSKHGESAWRLARHQALL